MLNLFFESRQEILFEEGVDKCLGHERAFVGLAPDSVTHRRLPEKRMWWRPDQRRYPSQ
jgi:hypothetical protein